jgi:hypothetical protein
VNPFDRSREEMTFSAVSFVPSKKKKKGGKKKKKVVEGGDAQAANAEPEPLTFESLESAVKGGWEPGTSFSFIAKVSGQARGMDVLSTGTRDNGLEKMYGQ